MTLYSYVNLQRESRTITSGALKSDAQSVTNSSNRQQHQQGCGGGIGGCGDGGGGRQAKAAGWVKNRGFYVLE